MDKNKIICLEDIDDFLFTGNHLLGACNRLNLEIHLFKLLMFNNIQRLIKVILKKGRTK